VRKLPEFVLRSTGKATPSLLWKVFDLQCVKAGFTVPKFALTFDCDTKLDYEVLPFVHQRLAGLGITPIYAVPGQLIEEGVETYKAIAELGAQFINHGYLQHTVVDESRTQYVSTLFYDQMSDYEIINDIKMGHTALVECLGIEPHGFRTPHFGTFQLQSNLDFLHGELKEMGYSFSSSTSPKYAFLKGPSFSNKDVLEIPVTGCPTWPLGILDSFNFRFSGSSKFTPEAFEYEMKKAYEMMEKGELKRVNMYADPSQVYDWNGFFESVAPFAPFAVANFESYLEE
jgi:hypothetical protein